MKYVKKFFITLMAVVLCMSALSIKTNAGSVKVGKLKNNVLFIGNSITYRNKKGEENHYIKYLKGIAKESGITLNTYKVTKGGSNLSYWTDKSSYKKKLVKALSKRKYDYIVIQQNTDYAMTKQDTTVKQAKNLLSLINKYQKEYKIIWNASWNYKNGAQNKSYSKGQDAINKTYKELKKKYGGQVAWSGNAFRECKSSYSKINLWVKDNNHPTYYGSYLSACCTFETMFDTITYKNPYNPDLKSSYLRNLQKTADKVCK